MHFLCCNQKSLSSLRMEASNLNFPTENIKQNAECANNNTDNFSRTKLTVVSKCLISLLSVSDSKIWIMYVSCNSLESLCYHKGHFCNKIFTL